MPVPTLAEYRARHPRFNAVSDALTEAYLAAAARRVDETVWSATDYADGVLYLTAHLMLSEGATDPSGPPPGTLKRVKAGRVEVEYAPQPNDVTGLRALYGTTVYGRQFLELLIRNQFVCGPGVLVV